MTQARPENHFSTIRCGTAKRLSLAGIHALLLFIAMALLSAAADVAVAQDIFGRISGTVTDSSGAYVAGAKVTIVNEATQVTRETAADKNGYFVASCQ